MASTKSFANAAATTAFTGRKSPDGDEVHLSSVAEVPTVAQKPAQKKAKKPKRKHAIPQYPVYLAHADAVGATETNFGVMKNTPYDHASQLAQRDTQLPEGAYSIDDAEPHETDLSPAERLHKVEKQLLHAELVTLYVSGDEEAFAARREYRYQRFGSEKLL